MAERFDALIVGCGIAGASLAFFLAERGLRVAVLERSAPASGGTGLSAAIIRQHYSTPLMARLALKSVRIFQGAQKQLGRDAGYRNVGYMFLTPPDALATTERNVAMQREIGIDTRMMQANEMSGLEWLNPKGVAGIVYEPEGGFADPQTATEAFINAAVEKGTVLRLREPVRALLRRGDRIEGVATDTGDLLADWVINAAGPWAAALAQGSGIDMAMRVVREQDTVWEARGNRPLPTHAISNAVDAIYIRPLDNRRYIVGRGYPKTYVDVDPCNYKQTADEAFVNDVQQRLTRRIPTFDGARLVHSYAALYDVTVDWYQYVGPRAAIDGYADFCGGSGHGFKVAPAIAAELADWLVYGNVADDFRKLSHDRVASGNLFVQSYGGNRG